MTNLFIKFRLFKFILNIPNLFTLSRLVYAKQPPQYCLTFLLVLQNLSLSSNHPSGFIVTSPTNQ